MDGPFDCFAMVTINCELNAVLGSRCDNDIYMASSV